ncbi:MAG: virulence factor [Burkholderiaceae bacterium]
MAKLIVISWRDVPAQVLVKSGRETAKVQLSHRFQEAVDRAAMRAGKSGSEAYLADWKRSEPRRCGDNLQAEAQAEADRIEVRYSDADLLRIIRAHGVDETLAAPGATPPSVAAPPAEPGGVA